MNTTIKCPKCGKEYLPCEIYLPDSFLGKARNIERENKNIVNFMGKSMDLKETYICDDCGANFDITAKVSFSTALSSVQISNRFVQKIKRPRLYELSED